jgi:hypothetical protein
MISSISGEPGWGVLSVLSTGFPQIQQWCSSARILFLRVLRWVELVRRGFGFMFPPIWFLSVLKAPVVKLHGCDLFVKFLSSEVSEVGESALFGEGLECVGCFVDVFGSGGDVGVFGEDFDVVVEELGASLEGGELLVSGGFSSWSWSVGARVEGVIVLVLVFGR